MEEDDDLNILKDICIAWGVAKISSPIEQIIFAELLFETRCIFGPIIFEEKPQGPFILDSNATTFRLQEKFGPYTADFSITLRHKDGHREEEIIIECDGHDYHERTKEQAAHDRKRDRWFTAEGIKVFRFTGSEIFNNSSGCVEEIVSFLEDIYLEWIK